MVGGPLGWWLPHKPRRSRTHLATPKELEAVEEVLRIKMTGQAEVGKGQRTIRVV